MREQHEIRQLSPAPVKQTVLSAHPPRRAAHPTRRDNMKWNFFNKNRENEQSQKTDPSAPAPERFPLAEPMPFEADADTKAERNVFLFVHQDMQLRSFD